MILIVGGRCQGKGAYAQKLLGQEGQGCVLQVADGSTGPWQQAAGADCILNFHEYIRQVLAAGEDLEQFVGQILSAAPEVITMDEVGCGIVPMERSQRDYREAVGHVGQRLAAAAGQVYRMVCGVPVQIK